MLDTQWTVPAPGQREKKEKKELLSELLELKRYVEDLECSASGDVQVFDF